MTIESMPADFISKWIIYAKNIQTTNFAALAVGILSIVIIIFTPKFSKKIPGSLIAIVVMTAIVYVLREFFGFTSIETIGDRFSIDPSLPKADAPRITFDMVQTLIRPLYHCHVRCNRVIAVSYGC